MKAIIDRNRQTIFMLPILYVMFLHKIIYYTSTTYVGNATSYIGGGRRDDYRRGI